MERTFNKNWFVGLGAFVFGYLGADRFMRGQKAWGIIKLITLGGVGIGWLIDALIAVYKAYGIEGETVTFINGKGA